MGKARIKRKSTLIDMTAMSDVTVLLLTFFMLTSTFLQKEPVTVITPSSVSEIKVPTANVATILVSPEGKIFLGIAGEADPNVADGAWATEEVRAKALEIAARDYEAKTGKKTGITQGDIATFAKLNMFGVPLSEMHNFLQLPQAKQDEYISDMANAGVGIPMKEIVYTDADGSKIITNEFQIWMRAIYNSGNENLLQAMKSGEGIAVKADHGTPYAIVHDVLDNLQTMKMNRFSVMTALKTEND
ncbi:MAG: biopolymer transporter ExbD [Muribaculaceae bacterium]|nr:biopolymer transporter ExbD [Muribaculaceae bacterium]